MPTALEIKKLWYEYEDCTSEEARVVKDLDKLEMIVQADDYEKGESPCCSFRRSISSVKYLPSIIFCVTSVRLRLLGPR